MTAPARSVRRKAKRMEIDYASFAFGIIDKMCRAGMTKKQVAEEAGVTPTQLSRAICGYTSLSSDAYMRLCAWSGVNPEAYIRRANDDY